VTRHERSSGGAAEARNAASEEVGTPLAARPQWVGERARRGMPLTPQAVLALQRTAGNQATRALLQRNEESKKILKNLAVPQVFPGPEVAAQKEIVEALEGQLESMLKSMTLEQKEAYDLVSLGGIELTDLGSGKLEDLIKGAALIELTDAVPKMSLYELAMKLKIDKQIIVNTLHTMQVAGQLDYLRESGLINNEFKIVVEIHYYRARNPDQRKFHKDTTGQTLFVNLNFVNDKPIHGPEYVVNPDTNEAHDKQVRDNLPPVFVEDVQAAKRDHGPPKTIGKTTVPPHGVVAFVDEAIHHKTPTLQHRTTDGVDVRSALRKQFPAEYADAEQAYEAFQARNWVQKKLHPSYSSYLKNANAKKRADEWYKIMDRIKPVQVKFDRGQLQEFIPADFLNIERLIEEASPDFTGAYLKGRRAAIKPEGAAPLKREMSDLDLRALEQQIKAQEEAKQLPRRTFFRTWVRAVRRK
jgi:hypothetical protein